jgi:sialic acid synthase SpsE
MNINRFKPFKLGSHIITDSNPTFIIAEIGTSHEGDLNKAKDLIIAAAESGVDCVKFQYVIAEEIIHPKTGIVDLPGGEISLFDRFKSLERPIDFYIELKRISEKNNLFFLCTPFGIESAGNLKRMGVEAIKIASPELNHYPLLEEVSELPLILSTGVSTLGDIEKALTIPNAGSALLHCITSYPAPVEEFNLKVLSALRAVFGLPVGVSDHSKDPVLVPVLSTALGASIIEKHITLSKTGEGLDDPIAIIPDELSRMCKEVRVTEKRKFSETIDWLNELYGAEKIKKITGTGIKKLAASELENYRTTNRSILAISDIEKDEIYTSNNTALLRSEKLLSPGLAPEFYPEVLKRNASRVIKSGEGITWNCL